MKVTLNIISIITCLILLLGIIYLNPKSSKQRQIDTWINRIAEFIAQRNLKTSGSIFQTSNHKENKALIKLHTTIALLLTTIFLSLSAIHFYWGLRGKKGRNFAIPTDYKGVSLMNPGSFECFVVAFGLYAFGLFCLIKSELINAWLPICVREGGLWIIAAMFLLRAIGEFWYVGFFKKVKNTPFGRLDTKYYSPLCLIIGILAILLEFL